MNATTQDPMSEPGLSRPPLRLGTLPVSPARARDTLPGSRKCSATTAAGAPCKAWAVLDTDPPLCSAHAGRNIGAGAPLGNQNRTTHGFYASVLSRNELTDVLEAAGLTTLESEIACTRAALRRLLKHLTETGDDLSPLDYAAIPIAQWPLSPFTAPAPSPASCGTTRPSPAFPLASLTGFQRTRTVNPNPPSPSSASTHVRAMGQAR